MVLLLCELVPIFLAKEANFPYFIFIKFFLSFRDISSILTKITYFKSKILVFNSFYDALRLLKDY